MARHPASTDDLITALALCVQADPPTNGDDHAVPGRACRRTAGGGSRVDTRSTQPQHPRPITHSLVIKGVRLRAGIVLSKRRVACRQQRLTQPPLHHVVTPPSSTNRAVMQAKRERIGRSTA